MTRAPEQAPERIFYPWNARVPERRLRDAYEGSSTSALFAGRDCQAPACPRGCTALAAGAVQVALWWTSQTVAAMSSIDSATSQLASIHWNAQNRLAGW